MHEPCCRTQEVLAAVVYVKLLVVQPGIVCVLQRLPMRCHMLVCQPMQQLHTVIGPQMVQAITSVPAFYTHLSGCLLAASS
jgi:hypothetical protein